MLRHLPTFQYQGLTIIMSNPARDDGTNKQLISGVAGWYFNEECLGPEMNRYQCDIRLVDDSSPLLPGTRCVMLLGQYAQSKYSSLTTTLDEQRGSPFLFRGIPTISSFSPQDAVDMVNHEARLNPEYRDVDDLDEDDSAISELIDSKGRGRTARSNYRFWLRNDTHKAVKLARLGKIPLEEQPTYHLWPSADEVIHLLSTTKGQHFYFDMETDFISADMRCFAFMFGNDPKNVWIVPWLTIDYKPAYDKLPQILRALATCMRDNITVAHNGAHFDFLLLALRYRIAIGEVYDTMVAQNRIFPTLEKSLGHCISLETYEPYHKNEGIHAYRNLDQAEHLYLYCGKDVFGMYLVHRAQSLHAAQDTGLAASIALANRSIKPYLTNSILGVHFCEQERQQWINNSDRLLTQYMRVMQVLTGDGVKPLISNQKCTEYFHNQLGYSVVARSKKTNNPSLAEDALYKLAIKYENPVIKFLIRYRQRKLQSGTLQFKTWRQTNEENKTQ